MTNMNGARRGFTRRMAEMTLTFLIRDGLTMDKVTRDDVAAAAETLYPGVQMPTLEEMLSIVNMSTKTVALEGLSEVSQTRYGLFAAAVTARYLYSCEPEASHECIAERMSRMYWTLDEQECDKWLPIIAQQEQYKDFSEKEKQLLSDMQRLLEEENAWRQHQPREERPSRSGRRRKGEEKTAAAGAVPAKPAQTASARSVPVKPAPVPPAPDKPAASLPAEQSAGTAPADQELVRMSQRESKVLARIEAQMVLVDLMVYLSDNGTDVEPQDDGKLFFTQICRETAAYRSYSDEELDTLYSNLTEADHALMDCGGCITDTIDKQISIIEMLCLQLGMAKAPVADLQLWELADRALEVMQTFNLRYAKDRLRRSLRRMADRTYGFGSSVPASVIARLHRAQTAEKLELLLELYVQEMMENQNRINQEYADLLAEQRAGDEKLLLQAEHRRLTGLFSDLCIRVRGGSLGDLAMGAHGCYTEEQLRISLRALLQQLDKHGLKPYGLEWTNAVVEATEDMTDRYINEQGAAVTPGVRYTLVQPGWNYKGELLFNAIMTPVE